MAQSFGTTEYLALLLGLYFLSAGAMLARNPQVARTMLDTMRGNPFVLYLSGIVAFCLGGTVVGLHSDFSSFLAGFVTIVGWAALLEGMALLAFPQEFLRLFPVQSWSDKVFSALGGLVILLGILLLVLVFY